jgi:metallo-beta-lactamase family protein
LSFIMNILPHKFEHEVPGGNVRLLGACASVTGAMTGVELAGQILLVDCGEPQGHESSGWQFPQVAYQAQALVLTHGHLDHVSAVPTLLQRFEGRIYGTAATLQLAELNLVNSLGLARASDGSINSFRRRFREQSAILNYNSRLALAPELALELHEAGHILGSASVEIESSDARILCSGDLGRPNSPLLRDYQFLDRSQRNLDLVVMESTYGDRDHAASFADIEQNLERIINRALKDGGHILIPAFSIGRTQTLLYYLNALVESGRLDNVPVAVDSPMALSVTEAYTKHRGLFDQEATALLAQGDDPLDFEGLYAVHRRQHSERLRSVEQPMIIIAGSGMCTGGRIVGHLADLLPLPETCVLFIGYQARGTLGRAIQQAGRRRGRNVTINGQQIPVRADIQTLSGLSAHADRGELAGWLASLGKVHSVALHHGERQVQERFARWLGRRCWL